MCSWVTIPPESDFPLENLPYGIFSTKILDARIGTAVGNYILDINTLAKEGIFASINFDSSTLEQATLNSYASLDRQTHRNVRQKLQELLIDSTPVGDALRDNEERRKRVLIPQEDAIMHLPMSIGDYTDFFVGVHHAQNVRDTL